MSAARVRRWMPRVGWWALLVLPWAGGLSLAVQASLDEERSAGEATVWSRGRTAFSLPFAHLDDEGRARFAVGNSFFRRNWVAAPASTRARDGLGPLFNARSCGACHDQDGRAAPPPAGEDTTRFPGLLLRLSVPADAPAEERPEPRYGSQLQTLAVPGVPPEGRLRLDWVAHTGRFDDGTPWRLRAPRARVDQLAHGALQPGLTSSLRIAPALAGAGLLDAIPDAAIEANAREQAAAGGPVRGRVQPVADPFTGTLRPGRFGWKAGAATVAGQTAMAFHEDIGITSRHAPAETCTTVQDACRRAPRGGDGQAPEIDDDTFSAVVFYQAALAPSARREPEHPVVRRGQRLFEAAGCAACHRPEYVTGAPPLPAWAPRQTAGLRIRPYTDLLLHDMGEGLADGRREGVAGPRDWRTPPLWGIGLLREVNGHVRLLHDGRADGVLEAVLWHGGEAQEARRRVLRMNAQERAALVRFVESL